MKVVDAELPVHITWIGVGRLPAVWIARHTKSLTDHTVRRQTHRLTAPTRPTCMCITFAHGTCYTAGALTLCT